MRIVTWNIRFGEGVEAAIEALTTRDQLRNADAYLLQEMDGPGASTLAAALGCHHVYAAASVHPRTGRDFGNAVLSPWPLDGGEEIELPHKARVTGQPRIALKATARHDDSDVVLCSIHTETPALGPTRRQEQFAALSRETSTWDTSPAIVGGDFNTVTQRGVRALTATFERVGFAHASVGATTTLRRAGRNFTLDHVFARGLTPVESGVVRQIDASDHAPVWVVLERPTEE